VLSNQVLITVGLLTGQAKKDVGDLSSCSVLELEQHKTQQGSIALAMALQNSRRKVQACWPQRTLPWGKINITQIGPSMTSFIHWANTPTPGGG
jgi:hypothetical protein